MKKEIIENYIFKGFGFPVILPIAVFIINKRESKFLDINMEELKDRVAFSIITYPYAFNGAMTHFIRTYIDFSIDEMADLLDVPKKIISNWEKKDRPINLTERQRSKLILKLKQHFFNKKEIKISEAILNSKDLLNEMHNEPLSVDGLYRVG